MVNQDKLRAVMAELKVLSEEDYAIKHSVKLDTVRRYKQLIEQLGLDRISNTKVLVLDIETSLIEASTFGVWKQNLHYTNIIKDWAMLTWSAKWLNSPEVLGQKVTSAEAIAGTDASIMEGLFKLLNEADVVIAHNGLKFDIPRVNTRLILNNYAKPSPFRQIDTLMVARRQFGFSHNKLDSLLNQFGIKGKTDTNMQLWIDCGKGDEDALEKMLKYNVNDVVILEDLYHEIKGWIPSHPRMYEDISGEVCEVCGSSDIFSNGMYSTNVNSYESFSCRSCGAVLRKRNQTSEELIVAAR